MCQIQFIKPYKMVNGIMREDTLKKKDERMFAHLMSLGNVSNSSAWGYFTNKTIERFPGEFNIKHLRNIVGESFVVGHNRYATKGDKNKNRNNHPFKSSRFIWVHNGVIDNDDEIRKKFNFQTKGEVDSAIIGQLIEKHLSDKKTVAQSIAEAIEKINGDYSIFLQDRKTNKLYYFRNSLRYFKVKLYTKRINKTTERYILVGSTDKTNMDLLYKTHILGLPINDYVVKSTVSINPNIVFEIDETGFVPVENFTPMIRETYPAVYNEPSKYAMNGYVKTDESDSGVVKDEITVDEIDDLGRLFTELGLEITITQNMSDESYDISEIKLGGKELDYLIDEFPEPFTEGAVGVLKPTQMRTLINLLQDNVWEIEDTKAETFVE